MFVFDGRIEVDDILEAGDEDFFTDARIQQDYFNLVREMKNPGSSQKGRVLTLYTARPVKDRQMYMDAANIPSGLFLTNSYSRAQGISMELSGSEQLRDIWRLRMEEKYLIQTLDGREKDYQVVGNGLVPVKRITLVDPGEA